MGTKKQLNIIYLDIEELRPSPENARVHEDYDLEQIKKSIEHFGFNDPIAVAGANNLIVEGHGRLEAAKRLGLKQVPVIRLDELTDEERREYMIMHNRTAELSMWDFKILAEEVENEELYDFDIDMGLDDVSEEDFDEVFTLNDSEVPLQRTISLTLSPEQYEVAQSVIDYFREKDESELHTFGNDNKNTNYFFEGVYQWAMQKNLL